jgi:hypothetical protein
MNSISSDHIILYSDMHLSGKLEDEDGGGDGACGAGPKGGGPDQRELPRLQKARPPTRLEVAVHLQTGSDVNDRDDPRPGILANIATSIIPSTNNHSDAGHRHEGSTGSPAHYLSPPLMHTK